MRRKSTKAKPRKSAAVTPHHRDLQVFTRFPPIELATGFQDENLNTTPAHVGEWELDGDAAMQIALASRRTSDERLRGLYAIEALLLAHELGLYPPKWACDFLAERFTKWHESQGKKSLDQLLGLRGKGKDPVFKTALINERNEKLVVDVARFVELGTTIEKASELVAARLDSEDWDHTPWSLGDIGADSIAKLYRAATWTRSPSSKAPNGFMPTWSEEALSDWLSRFPRDQLPENLKRLIKKSSA